MLTIIFPGKSLFPMDKAAEKGSIIMYLLSDAGQKQSWNEIKPHLSTGKTLYFSHGFSIVFQDQTGVCRELRIQEISHINLILGASPQGY